MSGSVLKPRGTSFASRLCDCCRGGCGYWFCHGTVLCYFRRPSFERVFSPKPRRPSFIRGHCEFGFCRGTVLRNPKRLSFIGGFCDCGRGTAPHSTDTNRLRDCCIDCRPRRPKSPGDLVSSTCGTGTSCGTLMTSRIFAGICGSSNMRQMRSWGMVSTTSWIFALICGTGTSTMCSASSSWSARRFHRSAHLRARWRPQACTQGQRSRHHIAPKRHWSTTTAQGESLDKGNRRLMLEP